jgi:hypothetical protein
MFTDEQKIANIATLEAITRSVAEGRPVKVDAIEVPSAVPPKGKRKG